MCPPIEVTTSYATPMALVWDVLTKREHMCRWFFPQIGEFEAKAGYEASFDVEVDGIIYPHRWLVSEVIPKQRITYGWRYQGYPGNSRLSWTLREHDCSTQVQLNHTVLESFPEDNPIFSREAGVEGWNYYLRETLPTYLESIRGNQDD